MGVVGTGIGAKTAVIAATMVATLLLAASASAELMISQTASPRWVNKGQLVTITVTVRNVGPGTATKDESGVELFSLRPGGAGHVNDPYQSATPSQGTCTINPTGSYQVADCYFGALAESAQAQVVAVVRVNEAMDHVAAPEMSGFGAWAELNVAAGSPPVLTGARQIKLRGLPAGCAPQDFTLTLVANVARPKRVVAHMFLGFDDTGDGVDWRRSAKGRRLKVKIPVSHIFNPTVGKTYKLTIFVQRRADTTLSRAVTFGLCQ